MKAIITYHSIDDSGSVISVGGERFREHMEILRAKGVPVLQLDDLLSPTCDEGVAITFDDGFQNFATEAWPVLSALEFPATVFVATDWVGRNNGWDPGDSRIPRLPLMGWETLRRLVAAGLSVGSHSGSHSSMMECSKEGVVAELEGSRKVIEENTGVRPLAFAYPYGLYDSATERAVQASGYDCGLTVELRVLSRPERSAYALPRLDAYYLAKPGVMEEWGSGSFLRYLRLRHAARRMRAALGGGR